MSDKILEALTQLFATISKQDGGATTGELEFVENYFSKEIDQSSAEKYVKLFREVAEFDKKEEEELDENGKPKKKKKRTLMAESVRVLKYCRKISEDLAQRQKVIILVKLLEMVAADRQFTESRMEIIATVASAFNFGKEDYNLIRSFVKEAAENLKSFKDILIVSGVDNFLNPAEEAQVKHIYEANLKAEIVFIKVSKDLIFVKYTGDGEKQDTKINGVHMKKNEVYLYSNGSAIKTATGRAYYYSDIQGVFLENVQSSKLSFMAENLVFTFPNGAIGLRDVTITEPQGKLIGIMGGSGAGKTTLLNVLAGIEKPSGGHVKINDIDIHREEDQIEGVIGYITQDDLLIEELTVYQNLYYNAKLCFKNLKENEIDERVMKVLEDLGLDHIRNLKVGNVLNKKISGGQRKRLNIALELIREPAVMFVDEPTSGLSSRDSENVIDLLKSFP